MFLLKKTIYLFSIILLFTANFNNLLMGQNDNKKYQIVQDAKIETGLAKHIDNNASKTTMLGYRIQIFFDSGPDSRKKANGVKSAFVAQYPSIPCYLTYEQPNFRIRVGDFRTKIEAQKVLNQLIQDYSNAYIVKDNILFPDL